MDSIILRTGENMAGAFKVAAASIEDYAKSVKKLFSLNKKG